MSFICWKIEVNIFSQNQSFDSPEQFIYHLKTYLLLELLSINPFHLKFGTYVPDINLKVCYVTIVVILLLTLFLRLTILNFVTRTHG